MKDVIAAARRREAQTSELAAAARYARERHDLYKARTFGSAMTSQARLRQLAAERDLAEIRLQRAQSEPAASPSAEPGIGDFAPGAAGFRADTGGD